MTEFRALDTETVNRAGGGYAILAGHYPTVKLEFPENWRSIWKLLAGKKCVAFNADFDTRALLHPRYLPYNCLLGLGITERSEWRSFRFEYIPTKFLRIRSGGKSFELYDLQQFFGLSLDAAALTHTGSGKDKIPKPWYAEMDRCLRDSRRDRILRYFFTDLERTQALCHKLLSSLLRLEITPRKLISPASISMQIYGKEAQAQSVDRWTNQLFSRAFYGGRVEVSVLGRVGPCKLYDIHSAYPAEIALLPSLQGSRIENIDGQNYRHGPDVRYGLYKIKVNVPLDWAWGPLSVYHQGRVIFPCGKFKTYCALPALEVLREYKIEHEIETALVLRNWKRPDPAFTRIEEFYRERKNPEIAVAVKLILNSLYGKFCETRARKLHRVFRGGTLTIDVLGRYCNFVLASHITESVRMKLWKKLHQYGRRAYFCATDSILVDGNMATAPDLGAWGLQGVYTRAVILGCGRYVLYPEVGPPEIRLRGFNSDLGTIKRLQNSKRKRLGLSFLETKSLKQWANTDGLEDLNVLTDTRHDFRIEDTKRWWGGKEFESIGQAFHKRLDSETYQIA